MTHVSHSGAAGSLNTALSPADRDALRMKEWKKDPANEFRFEYWLRDANIEVATVYELATGVSFPRRGELWTGLHSQLTEIRRMMLSGDALGGKTLGHYADAWLRARLTR